MHTASLDPDDQYDDDEDGSDGDYDDDDDDDDDGDNHDEGYLTRLDKGRGLHL